MGVRAVARSLREMRFPGTTEVVEKIQSQNKSVVLI